MGTIYAARILQVQGVVAAFNDLHPEGTTILKTAEGAAFSAKEHLSLLRAEDDEGTRPGAGQPFPQRGRMGAAAGAVHGPPFHFPRQMGGSLEHVISRPMPADPVLGTVFDLQPLNSPG